MGLVFREPGIGRHRRDGECAPSCDPHLSLGGSVPEWNDDLVHRVAPSSWSRGESSR